MSLSTVAFERLGLRIRPEEFERLVEEALAQMLRRRRDTSDRELTPAEARVLEEGGVSLVPREVGPESPLVRSAAEYAALLASALTVAEAADRLGVDGSRVRQRLAADTLYGHRGW